LLITSASGIEIQPGDTKISFSSLATLTLAFRLGSKVQVRCLAYCATLGDMPQGLCLLP
jgi:hypothetical protein